jgi:hypothetical protein
MAAFAFSKTAHHKVITPQPCLDSDPKMYCGKSRRVYYFLPRATYQSRVVQGFEASTPLPYIDHAIREGIIPASKLASNY